MISDIAMESSSQSRLSQDWGWGPTPSWLIAEVNPLATAPPATCPAFFVVAVDDKLILPEHDPRLHDAPERA